ncbi:MAG TPA: sensor histidine kinase N-terminal domain-containing protein [Methylibium sp.]|uniref:sensor histidine kinase n=1 Tax=Methylibium sp. TaxID=2067992 RepID=UPI002DB620B1|nr:sensor histidine kinase N-terminal domain-containing protein [Methylibium sp.]HEU4458869.1 sensor histidine kinase N-terminal domain-containing protein [Methylibium sp.]
MSRGQRSLFGEILDWMLAPLLLLWPMSVALTWLVAQNIANRPYDRALGDIARSLAQQVVLAEGRAAFEAPAAPDRLLRTGDADDIWFQVLGSRGEPIGGEATLPTPPIDEPAAPAGELRFRDDEMRDRPVRVAYLWAVPAASAPAARASPAAPAVPPATAPVLVQVAETLDKRSQLATEIIKGVILPQFVILPVAVLLVWFALARGIAPLDELQRRIRQRDSDDLSPIDERDAPEEVSPLVRAINDLLGRLDRSFATQRRFLADAAHQLKTPLSGLRTQAEIAQREIDLGEAGPESLKRTLQQIARSSQRAAHTVNQLLAMARAEDRGAALRLDRVDLAALAMETVQDFVPRALDGRIDLGFEQPPGGPAAIGEPEAAACVVAGHAVLLGELIRNLVDNALHYSPRGGTVTVRVRGDPFGQVVVLQVEDSGPGIPAPERELVFQPFYRALGTGVDGSGLGLAIVAEIARRHRASLTLDDARDGPVDAPHGHGPGARFTLHFPAWPAEEPTSAVADG